MLIDSTPHANRTLLQVVLLRDHGNPETETWFRSLRLAFEGSGGDKDSPETYLADSVDLGIQVLDPAGLGQSAFSPQRLTQAARHTLLVTLEPLPTESAAMERLDELKGLVGEDHLVTAQLPGPVADGDIQLPREDPDEVEPSLYPVATALRAMERARRLLEKDLGKAGDQRLIFFISHAKIDGIPMALSLLSLMRRMSRHHPGTGNKDFGYFYDVEDIKPGDDWKNTLEQNARNSVLVALRTKEYEKRYWCRREYLWAEQQRMPILVVDLHDGTYQEGARLPVGPAPKVRIHDGNLIRILLHAMACHLRALCLEARTQRDDDTKRIVLPRHPSVIALQGVLENLKSTCTPANTVDIIYPTPRLSGDELHAFDRFLNADDLQVRLLTADELEA